MRRKPDHGMDYGTFIATEGGTVGNLSRIYRPGGSIIHISAYGHLPGYGCNSLRASK